MQEEAVLKFYLTMLEIAITFIVNTFLGNVTRLKPCSVKCKVLWNRLDWVTNRFWEFTGLLFKKITFTSFLLPHFYYLFVFCMNFEEKYFSHNILSTDQISLFDYLYYLRCWVMTVYFPGRDVINFRINFIKPFFCMIKKVRTKMKRAFKIK